MNNSTKTRKNIARTLSVSLVSLLLVLSLSGCSLFFLSDTIGSIIGNDGDIKIETTTGGPVTAVTTANGSPNDDIQIIEPGSLDLKEDPTVTDNQTDFTRTVERVAKSVVEIETESASYGHIGQYVQTGAGSGVIISHSSDKSVYYIVTNHHVIDQAESILVRLSDGTELDARLIATDVLTDVALLAVTVSAGSELSTAVFMNEASTLANGQDIFVIGNPLGELGGSVTKGIVSKTERYVNVDGIAMRLLQIDASINPGNSGGGLFDMSGNLVGIVNAKYVDEDVEGIGFAIPISTVRPVVQQLAEKGYVSGRPGLGFETADKQYTTGSILNSTTVTYPTVVADTSVSGSYTDENGSSAVFTFEKDDIITAVGQTTVSSSAELLSRLSRYSIGDTAELTVIRSVAVTQNGRTYYTQKQFTVSVTLVEYIPTV